MVVIEGQIWLVIEEIVDLVPFNCKEPLINTIRTGYKRNGKNKNSTWVNKKIDGSIHILYASIPESTASKYSLPSIADLKKRKLSEQVKPDIKAYEYYAANPFTHGRQQEYARIYSWLFSLASIRRQHCRCFGFKSMDDLYTAALQQMAVECDLELWKITSLQTLKRKLKPFNRLIKNSYAHLNERLTKKAYKSLISGKIGNSNSMKISKSQKALLIQIYSHPNKPSYEQTYFMYMQRASEMVAIHKETDGKEGWPEKSLVDASTVRKFLSKPKIQQMVFEHRHGLQQYRDRYEVVTSRKRPEIANGLWVIDGSPVHRYYIHNGKSYARLNVFVILDAHSWCVLGFYVSNTENAAAVMGGLRAACELSGKRPHQIQYDHSSAIKSFEAQSAIRAIALHPTPTAVGNARSKVIEPFFKQFNSQVLKFRTGYTASPVAAKTLDGQPNREALAKDSKLFPSSEVAIKELHEDFAIWNNRPFKDGKSPLQRYRESISNSADLQLEFTTHELVNAFYTMPGEKKVRNIIEGGTTRKALEFVPREYKYTNKGITYTVDGNKYQCRVNSAEFNAENIGKHFALKYDPVAPEKVYLYEGLQPLLIGEELCKADPVEKYSMALMDRQEGEAKRLADHLEEKKKQRALVLARYSSAVETTQLEGTYTPAITENAFDKNVLQAAQADIMEQIVQGDEYRLEERKKDKPSTKKLSRW